MVVRFVCPRVCCFVEHVSRARMFQESYVCRMCVAHEARLGRPATEARERHWLARTLAVPCTRQGQVETARNMFYRKGHDGYETTISLVLPTSDSADGRLLLALLTCIPLAQSRHSSHPLEHHEHRHRRGSMYADAHPQLTLYESARLSQSRDLLWEERRVHRLSCVCSHCHLHHTVLHSRPVQGTPRRDGTTS